MYGKISINQGFFSYSRSIKIKKDDILHTTIKVLTLFAGMPVFRHVCISPFSLGAPHPSAAIVMIHHGRTGVRRSQHFCISAL